MVHASLSLRARLVAGVAAWVLLTAGSTSIAAGQGNGSADAIRPLVSRPEGQEGGIWWAHISGNGKTAFVWTRDDLVPGLRPTDRYRLFAIDIATNQVRLVSDDGRLQPEAVSSDGRFIVASYELSTNVGPDRDEFTDAFIIGAAAPDPTAQVFVPAAIPLPPELFTLDTVSPAPIVPPPSQLDTTSTVP